MACFFDRRFIYWPQKSGYSGRRPISRFHFIGLILGLVNRSVNRKINLRMNPQSYRMVCRAGLACWLLSGFNPPSDELFSLLANATTFPDHLLSFFLSDKGISGLTDRDLDKFVKEDILDEYGPQAFLARFTQLLTDLRDTVSTDSQFRDLNAAINNLSKVVVHVDFRPHYISSGCIRALCNLVDNPRLLQYGHKIRWSVYRSVLVMVESVHNGILSG